MRQENHHRHETSVSYMVSLKSKKIQIKPRRPLNSETDSDAFQPFNVHRSRGALTLVLILEGWVGIVSARFAVLYDDYTAV